MKNEFEKFVRTFEINHGINHIASDLLKNNLSVRELIIYFYHFPT